MKKYYKEPRRGRNNINTCYIHGFVHRDTTLIRSNKMQQYAGIYLLKIYSTCFWCPSHPSSGEHKTVTAASGTGHSIWATTFLQRGLNAAVTVLCSPDDGCDGHQKHVESNFAVNKHLHTVASCWISLIYLALHCLAEVLHIFLIIPCMLHSMPISYRAIVRSIPRFRFPIQGVLIETKRFAANNFVKSIKLCYLLEIIRN